MEDDILRNPAGEPFRADRDYAKGELIEIPLEYLHEYFCIGHEWICRAKFRSKIDCTVFVEDINE